MGWFLGGGTVKRPCRSSRSTPHKGSIEKKERFILQAGPAAMGQALIVSVVTFGSIYLAATKLFGLDKRFAACLGAGGSICGVSGSIAIGGACRARQEHVSVAISLVIVWAVVMIFALPAAAKALGLHPGVAGAWIGTSEFADAAGFAAAETIGHEAAVRGQLTVKPYWQRSRNYVAGSLF